LVRYVTREGPPYVAATRTFSIGSPSKVFAVCVTVKVAKALITLGSVVETVTLALAVEAAWVPLRGKLLTVLAAPFWGVTTTVTMVPIGIFVPASSTVTGLVVVAGKVISGVAYEPVGCAGAASPATAVIFNEGVLEGKTAPGLA
jgi:hypothetical protein